jgi:hypothetical protein
MTDAKKPTEDCSSSSCGSWDRSDPHQQEVTRILKSFKNDLMGITHLASDGVLRSLTADRKVLSAQGLSTTPICLVNHEKS